MSKRPKIATYKGVPIYYAVENGRLLFEFEGDREVNYLFEAERIIDEPKWEPCDLKGFYLDHSLEYHIGLAKAERKDTKTGRPDWLYRGKYDLKYERSNSWTDDKTTVYPDNPYNREVYKRWEVQRERAVKAQREADDIAKELKANNPSQEKKESKD